MAQFDDALIVTHIVFRKAPPFEPLEGPYSSVAEALKALVKNEVFSAQLPINGFEKPYLYGPWKQEKRYSLPSLFGQMAPVKYFLDSIIFLVLSLLYSLRFWHQTKLVVGIDPLSCLPLTFFKKWLNYKLVFYSVDFNRTRFKNKILQWLYEKADEMSAKGSHQTWVVCQSLKDYKKKKYAVESFYIPNSSPFNPKFFGEGQKLKEANKMAWTGSFLTDKQYEILFGLLSEVQKIRPEMEFYFAPLSHHEKFRAAAKKYQLSQWEVLELHSRAQWQTFAAQCDLGIAVYDPDFGSTEFIEPLKIWDFLICGLPFIISAEPSISNPIKESGVAYILGPNNQIVDHNSLQKFLNPEEIRRLAPRCLELAEEFDIQKQIEKALAALA